MRHRGKKTKERQSLGVWIAPHNLKNSKCVTLDQGEMRGGIGYGEVRRARGRRREIRRALGRRREIRRAWGRRREIQRAQGRYRELLRARGRERYRTTNPQRQMYLRTRLRTWTAKSRAECISVHDYGRVSVYTRHTTRTHDYGRVSASATTRTCLSVYTRPRGRVSGYTPLRMCLPTRLPP